MNYGVIFLPGNLVIAKSRVLPVRPFALKRTFLIESTSRSITIKEFISVIQ